MFTKPIRQGVPEEGNGQETPSSQDSELVLPLSDYPFLLPPVQPDEIGRLGNYRVLRLIGQGGMGFVFQAEDLALCRPVALKVLNPDLDRSVCGWARFLREARAMASIKHESLVTVYQVGQEGDVVYLAMELLQGESLEDWLARVDQPKPVAILRVAQEIAGGLVAIHRHGLLHRDIKPANLWMEEGGRVKILDFGLARFIDDDAALTKSGTILGTPHYMSPEQARGEPVDSRSDLFSFGGVLYYLCTGTRPFRGSTATAALTALAVDDPIPVTEVNPAIPQALSDLVAQLLAKKPGNRPASAEAVLECLQQIGQQWEAGPLNVRSRSTTRWKTRATGVRKRRPFRRWGLVSLALLLVAAASCMVAWITAPGRNSGTAAPARIDKSEPAPPVYLSTLEPIHKENWPFLPPPHPGKPWPRAVGGFWVQGKESPHGIFMHPAPPHLGSTNLTYQLGKEFKTFRAEVALTDGCPPLFTPVTFVVHGDGRLLWKSRPVGTPADLQTCTVSVEGVDRLKIEVACPGDPRGAHAVWVEPSVAR